nr:NAD-dependent epimerase/dehydratase family protein [uncultured Cellulosilyticum sp.]
MSKILITGANGFIGKNLLSTLQGTIHKAIPIDIHNTQDELISGLKQADFIIHLAGVNRTLNLEDFQKGNVDFTAHLLGLIDKLQKNVPLIISSSTQAALDNPYGKSKKAMEDYALNWSKSTGNKVYIYRLTNVFGKWCQPNYNCVVATFCYNISHNLPIHITDDNKMLNLIYIDDVISSFLYTLENHDTLQSGLLNAAPTYSLTLLELANKIKAFKQNSSSLLMPSLLSLFDRALYATYLSYLEPTSLNYSLTMHTDSRGTLSELIKSNYFGQIFISTTKPGVTRGNHWHHTKTEKFVVLQGEATISLRSIFSTEVIHYNVSGQKIEVIDIPPGYTHNITNSGQTDLLTLFWASEPFNNSKPDTYYEEV